MPVERARGVVVARRPVLVEALPARCGGGGDRVRERQPAVGRAAHEDVGHGAVGAERDGGDEPHVVSCVVGDGGIADPWERPGGAQVGGDARQRSACPALAAVRRRCEPDVGGAAVEEAPALGDGHDRAAEREGVRLHGRGVLAGGVRERIGEDPGEPRGIALGGGAGCQERGRGQGRDGHRAAEHAALHRAPLRWTQRDPIDAMRARCRGQGPKPPPAGHGAPRVP